MDGNKSDAYAHFIADVNGDGKADLVQVQRNASNGYVGLSNGDGSFLTRTWSSPTIALDDAYDHYVADVNGDGKETIEPDDSHLCLVTTYTLEDAESA